MVRAIVTWRILGEDLVGTYHVPTPGRAGGLSGAASVGILLLNPGSAMRSGNSDLSVRIGHRLALRGFPVFRFDLAGLGDSSGTTSEDVETYWDAVVNGRNDAATVALIERIRVEFGVARVIVGGLCAAAIPSVHALGAAGAAPAGLILLEPNFRLTVNDKLDRARPAASHGALGRSATQLRRSLSALGSNGQSRLAQVVRPVLALSRRVADRLTKSRLPRDANVPLITRWQTSFERGVHSLVVVAAGQGTDRYMKRIFEALPAPPSDAVSCVRVPGTNHLFTSGAGRDAVLVALERWVMTNFGGNVEPSPRRVNGS